MTMKYDKRKVFRRDRRVEGRTFDIIADLVKKKKSGRRISDFKETVAAVRSRNNAIR